MNINVLILSAGRRVELVKCFKNAAKELGVNSTVITADLSDSAPASYFSDKNYKVPRVTTSEYIDSVIEICNQEEVKLVVPTIDTELLTLAKNRERLENETQAKILISNEEVIKICRDKITTSEFFKKNGFGVPNEIKDEDLENENYEFPLFIKPIDGSSSVNTFKVNNKKELDFFREYVDKPIIQSFISGIEYTVDVFLDFDSNIKTIVPRERIATRSGEISKGRIVKNLNVIEEVRKVMEVLKPIGHITVQCIETKEGIKFIEINPRFGGGAPMSIKAGADSPKSLYKLLRGEDVEYTENFDYGLLVLRFDDAIFINKNGELV
ncbi:ATP-grasp domain-containing protein [Clostridium perfringens]